ncbi:MAG: proton-conducting membrane transporter [Clostridia bacterium]|nr:proton-conducting membrane transporter [Clostridia bacterium]
MLILLTLLVPLVGGALLGVMRPKTNAGRAWFVEAVVIATSILVWTVLLTDSGEPFILYHLTNALPLTFRVDGMSRVFAGLVSLLWPIASLYGFEYMHHEERPTPFFMWYTISYAATLAIAFAGNLCTLYVFYECLTLVTLPLVIHKKDAASIRAGRKYLTYSITGAAFAFIALVVLIFLAGSTEFTLGGVVTTEMMNTRGGLLLTVFVLAFIGFGTKAAVFPMHAWLPAASVAPTPVTALLHAVAVVNAGAYAVLRLIYYSFGAENLFGTWAQAIVLCLACFTIVFGSTMAVREQHFKRRLAWSTISNLSYMLMGAALMTEGGMVGSLSHLVIHGVIKITLFYCAGAILVRTGKEYVQDLRGFGKVMPLTCAAYVVGGVALTGIPPLAGFVSKWNLLTAAADTGLVLGTVAVLALIISAVLTAIYIFTAVLPMYGRPLNAESAALEGFNRDPGWQMKLPLVLLMIAIVALGLWSTPLVTFLRSVAAGLIQ